MRSTVGFLHQLTHSAQLCKETRNILGVSTVVFDLTSKSLEAQGPGCQASSTWQSWQGPRLLPVLLYHPEGVAFVLQPKLKAPAFQAAGKEKGEKGRQGMMGACPTFSQGLLQAIMNTSLYSLGVRVQLSGILESVISLGSREPS